MVVNLPLCWPLLQRIIRIGPWTEARSRSVQNWASSRKTQPRPQRRFGVGVGIGNARQASGSSTLLSISSTLEDMAAYGVVPPSRSASKEKKSAYGHHPGFVVAERDIELQLAPPRRAELDSRTLGDYGPHDNAIRPDGARTPAGVRSSLASEQENSDGGVCVRTMTNNCHVVEPSTKFDGVPACLGHP